MIGKRNASTFYKKGEPLLFFFQIAIYLDLCTYVCRNVYKFMERTSNDTVLQDSVTAVVADMIQVVTSLAQTHTRTKQ